MSPYTDWTSLLFNPIGTFVLLAIGLNIVVGHAGLLDLGFVAFYAIGAYTLAYLGIRARLAVLADADPGCVPGLGVRGHPRRADACGCAVTTWPSSPSGSVRSSGSPR